MGTIFGRAFALLAAAALATSIVAGPCPAGDTVRITGTGGAYGTLRILAAEYRKKHPDTEFVFLPVLGSAGGIKALLAGKADLAASSRPASAEERAQGAREHVYSKTALGFCVNGNVPDRDVKLADLLAIYEGRLAAWKDGTPVRLILRPYTDADVAVLRNLLPKAGAAHDAALRREGIYVAATDADNAEAMAKTAGAFGIMSLAQVETERLDVRLLALDGVAPSSKTLADGSWRITKEFFLVTREKASPAAAERFVAFVRSPASAGILRKAGQVPRKD